MKINSYSEDKRGSYERKKTSSEEPVKSQLLCQWVGCERKGVISPSTNGGKFYCRTHASEVMNIDFTAYHEKRIEPDGYGWVKVMELELVVK